MRRRVFISLAVLFVLSFSPAFGAEQARDEETGFIGMQQEMYEQKLKALEEKVKEHNDGFHHSLDRLTDSFNSRIESSERHYLSLLRYYTGGFALIVIIISIISLKEIKRLTRQSINTVVNRIITEEFVRGIIEKRAEPYIKGLMEDFGKKAKKKFGDIETMQEEYRADLRDMKNMKLTLETATPLSKEDRRELGEFVEKLTAVKVAESYSYEDWLYKGMEEYGKGVYDEAAESFRRASEKKPTADAFGNAALSCEKNKDYDKAEEYYKKALNADPNNAGNLGNYANFLKTIRKDYDTAEEYYKKALNADPSHAGILGNYALFLTDIRKDHDLAEEYYKKALAADPSHAGNLGNYATFLTTIRKDYDTAEEYYEKALAADPNDAGNLGNYAGFLTTIRKDHELAEEYYKKALAADPNDANSLGNYAGFLLARGKPSEGFEHLERALQSAENNTLILECRFYRYAHTKDSAARTESLKEIKALIISGERSPGWDLSANTQRAVKDGHPEPELLEAMGRVIADQEKAESLEGFKAWQDA